MILIKSFVKPLHLESHLEYITQYCSLSSLPDPGPETAPITCLAWQESSDDLWTYSYLWVLKSGIESLAAASLFPPSFSQRKIDSFEVPCNKGLEYVN